MQQFNLGRYARAIAAIVALPALAFAQNGRISGTVTDAAKGSVSGAQVLVNIVGLSNESGAEGKFTIANVPPGTYSLSVYRIGYKPKGVANVVVTAGDVAAALVSFAVGNHVNVLVLGAATHGLKMQRLLATVPIKVAMAAPCTVILVKQALPFELLRQAEPDGPGAG